MTPTRLTLMTALALGVLFASAGCTANAGDVESDAADFPVGAAVDYQLGGGYDPGPGVGIVARDATDVPADGVWSICYVNAFQSQPGEADAFADVALLRTSDGTVVTDPAWPDETVLDTRTDAARTAIINVVGPVIDDCGERGFDAVEFDNLDTFARFDELTFDDAVTLARTLTDRAHAAGLRVGQKNAGEYAEQLQRSVGFDFAVAEECVAFDECTMYTDVYGDRVIDVEYTDDDRVSIASICADPSLPTSTVLRDRNLTLPGDPEHVVERC